MIAIGSDHGGVELKAVLVDYLNQRGEQVEDVGTHGSTAVDYPDFGKLVAEKVARGEAARGILLCTNGIGMSILANKYPGVRAALVADAVGARMSREHLDANILIMGGGFVGKFLAREIVKVWMETPFAGGRHQRRLDKIAAIEHELGLQVAAAPAGSKRE
ncbi:MAG: ribose 5-phosphate isomerase B [Deltaproteobacteria bacterium]|nr:ribose 5-phosphate isomerase B [Deltaproteobacteria bacterium]